MRERTYIRVSDLGGTDSHGQNPSAQVVKNKIVRCKTSGIHTMVARDLEAAPTTKAVPGESFSLPEDRSAMPLSLS
jgi:hypothetical protein